MTSNPADVLARQIANQVSDNWEIAPFTQEWAIARDAAIAALQQSRSAVEAIPTAALYALRHGQQQADMDGTFVTVSRQAIDEVLDAIDAALSQESA